MSTIRRTYERFEIVFEGARWSGYRTLAEAEEGCRYSTRPCRIERIVFDVDFEEGSAALAMAERHGATPVAVCRL